MSVWTGDAVAIVGHRGGRAEGYPAENTLAAFERAFREGADAVELDVRLCATGEVVVFHDPDLKRATSGDDTREVRHVPQAELASLRLFGGAEGVPLLRDVLALVSDHGGGVNVELKHDFVDGPALVRGVARELAPFEAKPLVLVSSFDPRLIVRFKATRPSTPVALLTTSERKWSLPLALVATLAPTSRWLHAVHLERTQVSASVIERLRSRGVRVGVWTVNDVQEARAMRAMGVSWLITDTPKLLRRP